MDDDTLKAATAAATSSGMSVDVWVAKAVREQAQDEEAQRRYAAEWKPGPWKGWRTRAIDERGNFEIGGPNGAEVWRLLSSTRRNLSPATALRPFTGRVDENTMLLNSRGAVRTFGTADAAKRAIEIYQGRIK